MRNTLGVIVTFNPMIDRLQKNIDEAYKQVDKLIIYDNFSMNIDDVKSLCKEKNIELIQYDKNYGIATPLFDSVIYADELGYEYILTLDQDSYASANMVDELLNVINKDNNIAMVGARAVDERRTNEEGDAETDNIIDTHRLITSGALSRVKAILEVGNYNKELFIDYVDFEICYRLFIKGYKLYKCNSAILNHRPGNPVSHSFFGFKITTENYSPFRLYYFMRNATYCKNTYQDLLPSNEFEFLKFYRLKTGLKILFFEKDKIKKFRALAQGKTDSRRVV